MATYFALPRSGGPTRDVRDASKEDHQSLLLHAVLESLPDLPESLQWATERCDPQLAWTRNAKGELPLNVLIQKLRHGGLQMKTWEKPLQALLLLAPETAKVPNRMGQYPLHQVVKGKGLCRDAIGADSELRKYLKSPCHLDYEEGIGLLVESYPDALAIRETKSGLLPFQIAVRQDASLDTIYRLLMANLDPLVQVSRFH